MFLVSFVLNETPNLSYLVMSPLPHFINRAVGDEHDLTAVLVTPKGLFCDIMESLLLYALYLLTTMPSRILNILVPLVVSLS